MKVYDKQKTINSLILPLLITTIQFVVHVSARSGGGGGGTGGGVSTGGGTGGGGGGIGIKGNKDGSGSASLDLTPKIVIIAVVSVVVFITSLCIGCTLRKSKQIVTDIQSVKEIASNENRSIRSSSNQSTTKMYQTPLSGVYVGKYQDSDQNLDIELQLDFVPVESGGYEVRGTRINDNGGTKITEGFMCSRGKVYWMELGGQYDVEICVVCPCVPTCVTKFGPDISTEETKELLWVTFGKFNWITNKFKGEYRSSLGQKGEIELHRKRDPSVANVDTKALLASLKKTNQELDERRERRSIIENDVDTKTLLASLQKTNQELDEGQERRSFCANDAIALD